MLTLGCRSNNHHGSAAGVKNDCMHSICVLQKSILIPAPEYPETLYKYSVDQAKAQMINLNMYMEKIDCFD